MKDKQPNKPAMGDDYFPKNTMLTREESDLFRHMSARHRVIHRMVYEQLKPGLEEAEFNSKQIDKTVDYYAQRYCDKAVRGASVLYFTDTLRQAAEEAAQKGDITNADLQSLQGIKFDIRAVNPFSFSVTEKTKKTGRVQHADSGPKDFWDTNKLENSKLIENYLADIYLSRRAEALARDVLKKTKAAIDSYDRAVNILGDEHTQEALLPTAKGEEKPVYDRPDHWLTQAWSHSRMHHKTPAFAGETERKQFADMLTASLSKLVVNLPERVMEDSEIHKAVDAFAARVGRYDARMVERLSNPQEPKPKKKNNGPQTDNNTVTVPMPLVQPAAALQDMPAPTHAEQRTEPFILGADAAKIMRVISGFKHGGGPRTAQAEVAEQAVEAVMQQLDLGKDGMRELGNHLLCPAAVLHLGKVNGLGASLKTLPEFAMDSVTKRAEKLGGLYRSSPDVRKAVDTLLADNEGALLLALQTRDEQQCTRYATLVAQTRSIQKEKDAGIHSIFGNASPEEIVAITTDPDLQSDPDVQKVHRLIRERRDAEDKLIAARHAIAGEILQALGGISAKKVGKSDITIHANGDAPLATPEAWQGQLNGHYEVQKAHSGREGFVSIHSKEQPEMSFEIRANASKEALAKALGHFAAECSNNAHIERLIRDKGFERNAPGERPALNHKPYEIHATLELGGQDTAKVLSRAEAVFDRKKQGQDQFIQTLSSAGIIVSQEEGENGRPGAITATLPTPQQESFLITSSGYISKEDTRRMSEKMGLITEKPSSNSHANGNGHAPHLPPRKWTPDKKDTVIIFDTSTLENLCSHRGNSKKTWLELVSETAKLPNVKVVIPEIVGMFEMQRKVPQKGHETSASCNYVQVDTGMLEITPAELESRQLMKHVLKSSCHASVKQDGSIELTGPQSNIILMSTPGDKELYQTVYDKVLSVAPMHRHAKLKQYVYERGFGEDAITRIIHAVPNANITVVTDDMNYVYDRARAPFMTSAGRPVVYAGTKAYLEAEINASQHRKGVLAKNLETPDLSVEGACLDIELAGRGARAKKGKGAVLEFRTTQPDADHPDKQVSIISLLQKAARRAELLEKEAAANGNGPAPDEGGAGNWAADALRQTQERLRGIDPESIAARRAAPGDGKLR